jgi:Spy/CpxP family protein refolding chaperone
MRKLLIGAIVTFVLSVAVAPTNARQYQPTVKPEAALKARQKRDWKMLKRQQKTQKRSWKGAHLSRGARAQMKHQMQRERRALREQQRNDRQDLKDRQRLMKESTRQVH